MEPIQRAARRAARASKLPPDACCAICGLRDPEALVRVKRTVLDVHHVAGRNHSKALTIWLCRNHHAIEHEKLRTAGVDLRAPETVMDKLVAVLAAIGTFLISLGEHLCEWAEQLLGFRDGLDTCYPDWRSIPEAQP